MIVEIAIVAVAAVLWHALSLYADHRKRDTLAFERYVQERMKLDGEQRGDVAAINRRMTSLEERMTGLELRGSFR